MPGAPRNPLGRGYKSNRRGLYYGMGNDSHATNINTYHTEYQNLKDQEAMSKLAESDPNLFMQYAQGRAAATSPGDPQYKFWQTMVEKAKNKIEETKWAADIQSGSKTLEDFQGHLQERLKSAPVGSPEASALVDQIAKTQQSVRAREETKRDQDARMKYAISGDSKTYATYLQNKLYRTTDPKMQAAITTQIKELADRTYKETVASKHAATKAAGKGKAGGTAKGNGPTDENGQTVTQRDSAAYGAWKLASDKIKEMIKLKQVPTAEQLADLQSKANVAMQASSDLSKYYTSKDKHGESITASNRIATINDATDQLALSAGELVINNAGVGEDAWKKANAIADPVKRAAELDRLARITNSVLSSPTVPPTIKDRLDQHSVEAQQAGSAVPDTNKMKLDYRKYESTVDKLNEQIDAGNGTRARLAREAGAPVPVDQPKIHKRSEKDFNNAVTTGTSVEQVNSLLGLPKGTIDDDGLNTLRSHAAVPGYTPVPNSDGTTPTYGDQTARDRAQATSDNNPRAIEEAKIFKAQQDAAIQAFRREERMGVPPSPEVAGPPSPTKEQSFVSNHAEGARAAGLGDLGGSSSSEPQRGSKGPGMNSLRLPEQEEIDPSLMQPEVTQPPELPYGTPAHLQDAVMSALEYFNASTNIGMAQYGLPKLPDQALFIDPPFDDQYDPLLSGLPTAEPNDVPPVDLSIPELPTAEPNDVPPVDLSTPELPTAEPNDVPPVDISSSFDDEPTPALGANGVPSRQRGGAQE